MRRPVARRGGRHQEAGDALLAGGLVGDGEDDGDIGVLAGGDVVLDAVEHEMVAVTVGAGGDGGGVGAGVRLGQAEAAELLATGQRLEPFFLLGIGAVLAGDAAGQRVLHRDDGRGGAIAGGDFFQRQHQAHVVHAGAAPLLGHDHAHGAEFAQFLQGLGREGVLPVPFGGEGGEALLREGAHRVADHFLFLRENHVVFPF
jgi:hypothetical protein